MDWSQRGDGAECELGGLYVVDGDRHADTRLVVSHGRSHGVSKQYFKGIVDDRGHGIFNGKIVVAAGTKGTDAHQTNANLLLSEEAEVDTRPQLEIDSDDVACSHGATVGQIDRDALFYLRSRGIPDRQARRMMTWAFASDVIERIGVAAIRQRVQEYLATHVDWGSESETDR